MKAQLILALAWSVSSSVACSSSGGGGPAEPFNPFGTEPAPTTGSEPASGHDDPSPINQSSLEMLCVQFCQNIAAGCPDALEGYDCAFQCTSTLSRAPACEAQSRAYLMCFLSTTVTCNNVSDLCRPSGAALEACLDGQTPGPTTP